MIANFVGQIWTAATGVAFIPLYIHYLGAEAFGVIGLFVVIQTCMSLLDMGMTPTLSREMARYKAGEISQPTALNLLRGFEIICLGVGILIAAALWNAASWLAGNWFKVQTLQPAMLQTVFSYIAIVVGLRFCEGIYRGALIGLKQQVLLNVIIVVSSTVRNGGVVLALILISPSLKVFFAFQGAVSVVATLGLAVAVHASLPRRDNITFSFAEVRKVFGFGAGMFGISLFSLILTQSDKLILSRILPLADYGYYALAATMAGILSLVVGPVTQAIYPQLIHLLYNGPRFRLIGLYHRGSQLTVVATAPLAALVIFHAHAIVYSWSGNVAVADGVAPVFAVIVAGSFLNCLMWMPYQAQLAMGWTSLTLKYNAIASVILVPCIYFVAVRFGAIGTAWLWFLLNASYVVIIVPIVHRRFLPEEMISWYVKDVLTPVAACAAAAWLTSILPSPQIGDRLAIAVYLAVCFILIAIWTAMASGAFRGELLGRLGSAQWLKVGRSSNFKRD